MPAFKKIEQADNTSFSLKDADRPLSEIEIEAEERAEKFSIKGFKRIPPIPGTLGFLLRNIKGGNESVIEFLRWAQAGEHSNRTRFIKNFLILWENMDEFSRRRVDIFDHLCRKYEIPLKRFWGVLQEGLFDHNEQITQTALSGHKPEFIELLIKMSKDRRNSADRKIMAEAMNLTKPEPVVKIEDNSVHNTQNVSVNGLPSFSNSIQKTEDLLKRKSIPAVTPKALTEGEQNYIDAEWEDVNEKELVELHHEEALRQLAKEI